MRKDEDEVLGQRRTGMFVGEALEGQGEAGAAASTSILSVTWLRTSFWIQQRLLVAHSL